MHTRWVGDGLTGGSSTCDDLGRCHSLQSLQELKLQEFLGA